MDVEGRPQTVINGSGPSMGDTKAAPGGVLRGPWGGCVLGQDTITSGTEQLWSRVVEVPVPKVSGVGLCLALTLECSTRSSFENTDSAVTSGTAEGVGAGTLVGLQVGRSKRSHTGFELLRAL